MVILIHSGAVFGGEFARKGLSIGQHQIGHIAHVRAEAVLGEEPVVELARVANGWSNFSGAIPRDVVEFDWLLWRAESITANLQRVEHRLVSDLVADHLIERAAIRMTNARVGGLLGR